MRQGFEIYLCNVTFWQVRLVLQGIYVGFTPHIVGKIVIFFLVWTNDTLVTDYMNELSRERYLWHILQISGKFLGHIWETPWTYRENIWDTSVMIWDIYMTHLEHICNISEKYLWYLWYINATHLRHVWYISWTCLGGSGICLGKVLLMSVTNIWLDWSQIMDLKLLWLDEISLWWGFVINMAGFVLSMTVFVVNVTVFVLNMTGYV